MKTVQTLKDYTKNILYITAFADDFIGRLEGNNSQGIEITANYIVKVFNNQSNRLNLHTSVEKLYYLAQIYCKTETQFSKLMIKQ